MIPANTTRYTNVTLRSKKRTAFFIAALLLLGGAAPAVADGTVLRAKGCGDKVFVSTENGYSVLVASETGVADDGDKIVGNTDSPGFSSFYLPDKGTRFSASVDARNLAKSDVTTQIAAYCRTAGGERMTSGQ